jgi:hypothetical protein
MTARREATPERSGKIPSPRWSSTVALTMALTMA